MVGFASKQASSSLSTRVFALRTSGKFSRSPLGRSLRGLNQLKWEISAILSVCNSMGEVSSSSKNEDEYQGWAPNFFGEGLFLSSGFFLLLLKKVKKKQMGKKCSLTEEGKDF